MSQLVCYIYCDNRILISNGHILFLHKYNLVSFSQKKNSLHFPIKNLFFESKRVDVQKVWRSFHCTRSEPTGCRILGEKRNQIFLLQWERFFSKDNVCALQPRLNIFFPNLIFPCFYCMIQCIVDLYSVNSNYFTIIILLFNSRLYIFFLFISFIFILFF